MTPYDGAVGALQAPVAGTGVERASFTGNASEYFGIWIVNILLTILTLGIYSAWAKVRRNRYFYGNTVILGRGFEYHAKGKQILIGRLIVLALIIAINVLSLIPILGIVATLVFVVATPWLIQRGLRFNARVTSYRNVRFDFVGSAGGAFVAIFVAALVAFISLGILAPLASRWLWRYIFNNFRYGDRPFATTPTLGRLYRVWWLPAGLVVLGATLAGAGFFAVMSAAGKVTAISVVHMLPLLAFIIYALLFGMAALLYRAGVRNVVWSSATLDGRHEFVSDLSRGRYMWIAISNLVATVLTLGLMRPWAAVRMARYVNAHTGIRILGDPGEVLSSIAESGGVVGAEYMDFEGFDFGL